MTPSTPPSPGSEPGSQFLITTYTRATEITARTIASFEKAGLRVIFKSGDGRGFVMRNGKRLYHVLPGYLKEVTP